MLCDGDTFECGGRRFTFKTEWDDSMGAPWEEHEGHGVVTGAVWPSTEEPTP